MGSVAEHDGDAVRSGLHVAERVHGAPHDVDDARVAERNRVANRGEIAVEEDVIVVARMGRFADHAPCDGDLGSGKNDAPLWLDDLQAG